MTFPQFPSLAPAAINHLLAQEPWARDKLAKHAGKVAAFDIGLIVLRLRLAVDGLVEPVPDELAADVTVHVRLADVPLMMQKREHAFSYVKIEGDADLANTISQVAQSLRWEAEEDVSRLVGDIAAARIVGGARAALGTIKATQQKLAENTAEYFLEENAMLIRPQAVTDFASDVARLRDDVERLAKRIEKLEGRKQ